MEFHPLTPDRWEDFARLFGAHGAYGGCWCMWWRETRAEFEKRQGAGNRRAMKQIVESGEVPGILAYAAGEPAGWISIAPREKFSGLERSRVLKRIDDTPVWSIVCFFVGKEYRSRGLAVPLIRAAVEYAAERGAKVVEAYPTLPKAGPPGAGLDLHGDPFDLRARRIHRVRPALGAESGHALHHRIRFLAAERRGWPDAREVFRFSKYRLKYFAGNSGF